jgi:hypothetical protein
MSKDWGTGTDELLLSHLFCFIPALKHCVIFFHTFFLYSFYTHLVRPDLKMFASESEDGFLRRANSSAENSYLLINVFLT